MFGSQVRVVAGAGGYPAIWLSNASNETFKNLCFQGYRTILIGFDSNGSTNGDGVSSWNWLFENVFFGPSLNVGWGPAVTIGGNTVNGYFNHCGINGNPNEGAAISSLSRSSDKVTVTTKANLPSSWIGSMHIGIFGVSDDSFDGLFTAKITGAKTFTYSQPGPSADSTGGFASSDKAQAIVINPDAASNLGDGLIFVEESFLAGAGIRAYAGSNGGPGLYVRDTWQESGVAPPVHVQGCPGSLGVRVTNIQIADNRTSFPGVRMDTPTSCTGTAVVQTTTVDGPAHLAGMAGPRNPLTLPDAMGQSGLYANHVFAQTDTPRRAFGPVVTRYTNLASQVPSTLEPGLLQHCGGNAGIGPGWNNECWNTCPILRSSEC